jgi:hypothetical protein
MSQQVITTTPVRFRYRAPVIVLGVVAALAIGVGVAVNSIGSGGSETSVQQAAPAAPVPPGLQLCGNDATNLVGAIATMPGSVQAQVMGTLSAGLSDALGHLVLSIDPTRLTVPDSTTLGMILTRVSRADRNTIVNHLPDEQGAAVAASWKSANVREYLSSTATPCS